MLHSKFQAPERSGSEEEDFFPCISMYGSIPEPPGTGPF